MALNRSKSIWIGCNRGDKSIKDEGQHFSSYNKPSIPYFEQGLGIKTLNISYDTQSTHNDVPVQARWISGNHPFIGRSESMLRHSVQNDKIYSGGDTNGIKKPLQRKEYDLLEMILLCPRMTIIKAFCQEVRPSDMTRLGESLLSVFSFHKRVPDVMNQMIFLEAQLHMNRNTLFRTNSLVSYMISRYAKIIGTSYLKTILARGMLHLFETIEKGTHEYEIDPCRIKPGQSLHNNVLNLQNLVSGFLDHLIESKPIMPRPLMEIMYALVESTRVRFPDAKFFVVGGFLFLRFVCPAIILPGGYNIYNDKITDKQRRVLVLVSKTIQKIVNDGTCGEKEEFMGVMDEIVAKYQPSIRGFFDECLEPLGSDTPENIIPLQMDQTEYNEALKMIYGIIENICDKLLKNPHVTMDMDVKCAMKDMRRYKEYSVDGGTQEERTKIP